MYDFFKVKKLFLLIVLVFVSNHAPAAAVVEVEAGAMAGAGAMPQADTTKLYTVAELDDICNTVKYQEQLKSPERKGSINIMLAVVKNPQYQHPDYKSIYQDILHALQDFAGDDEDPLRQYIMTYVTQPDFTVPAWVKRFILRT